MNIMRNKIYYALLVMLFSFSLVACGNNGNSEQHNNEESELVEKGGDLSSMYGGNEPDCVKLNKDFLETELELSETRAEGAAIQLDKAGCGIIIRFENREDFEHSYRITLINKDGDKYIVSIGETGYIGTIQNENGDYLLAPID